MRALLGISLLAAAAAFAPAADAEELARGRVAVPPLVAPVAPAGRIPSPASVLFIGAHPDDEVPVAPLLAHWCREGAARCSMLIATRGERGPCLLAGGCLPDLATVRSGEAAAAAAYFHADLVLLSLPDGGGVAPPSWAPGTPDAPNVVAALAGFIRAAAPEIVVTFDPRHGTTCHPDHRALGELVPEALALLAAPPALYLVETRVDVDPAAPALRFAPATTAAAGYDASLDWSAVVEDMERHSSQFDAAWRDAAWRVPEADRAVFLGLAAAMLERPAATCP
jgi:LmbE family N-acetylglucosaminyl deacetylase